MVITSLPFLAFCIASVILFIIFPPKYRWISLLISSIAFYLISAKWLFVYILITSLTIWAAARIIDRIRQDTDAAIAADGIDRSQVKTLKKKGLRKRRTILIIALILNIGILVAFKVFNFFSGALAAIVGIFTGEAPADALTIILPLGISYYTFSTVGYMLDVYWKRYESEQNPIRFFLYAVYYPHIVQGPISRYDRLGAELKKPELKFRWDNFVVGMEKILLGMFKKLVIADRASVYVSGTLNTGDLSGSVYILTLILDAIQIYSDFSGYMDIVSGISLLFDVELEQNFNHPFLSKSVPEFWRRWHMSLGSWFKDYVYYPITVTRAIKKLNKKIKPWRSEILKTIVSIIIPVMITWILTGLWHGTGKGYLAWGLYYGTLILLSVAFSPSVEKLLARLHINTGCLPYRVFQTLKIFCIFMGGRFLAAAIGMPQRKMIIKKIFTSFDINEILDHGLDLTNLLILAAGVIILIAIAVLERKTDLFTWFNKKNRIFCAIVLYIILFSVFILGIYGSQFSLNGFMYQAF